jgi:hypothetical protein
VDHPQSRLVTLDSDYDVLTDGVVVGRIFRASASPEGAGRGRLPLGNYEDRTPTHGHEPTREGAMAAFGKSWRHE